MDKHDYLRTQIERAIRESEEAISGPSALQLILQRQDEILEEMRSMKEEGGKSRHLEVAVLIVGALTLTASIVIPLYVRFGA